VRLARRNDRVCQSRDKPLALYVFTSDDKFAERVLRETSSGGAVINDVLMQCVVPQLPFGGIGESGMGAYHGKFSFDMFSHQKSILKKSFMAESLNALALSANHREEIVMDANGNDFRTQRKQMVWLLVMK
jgi:delta 1-pyrroline-5-carboxylate dehydrogenase